MRKESETMKAIKGTGRADRVKSAPSVVDEMPAKKTFVPTKGKKLYNELVEYLNEHEALAHVDSYLISIVAHSYQLFEKYAKHCNKLDGCIQTFANGTSNISPEYTVLKTERKFLMDSFSQLGIGQQSREKILAFINALEPKDKQGLMYELLNGSTKTG